MKLRTAALACFLTALLTIAVHRPGPNTFLRPVAAQPELNRYQIAQRQTALVINSEGGQGSAVVIKRQNSAGRVRIFAWSAGHVVGTDESVIVRIFLRHDGHKAGYTTYTAKVLGRSAEVDVALLQIDCGPEAFFGASFASDTPALPGDPVYACGNFRGAAFDTSISRGVISQIGVAPGDGFPWPIADQSDCPSFPGSSGGPLFNLSGEVLGLVVGGLDSALVWFVPIRAISEWAQINGFGWAIRGSSCPADSALR